MEVKEFTDSLYNKMFQMMKICTVNIFFKNPINYTKMSQKQMFKMSLN